jgi:hypothetical protein
MATGGEISWPPAGRNRGHQWGISWPPVGRTRWPLTPAAKPLANESSQVKFDRLDTCIQRSYVVRDRRCSRTAPASFLGEQYVKALKPPRKERIEVIHHQRSVGFGWQAVTSQNDVESGAESRAHLVEILGRGGLPDADVGGAVD